MRPGDRQHAFGYSDVRLLSTLAANMGVALENARLFDETTRLLKETEQRAQELAIINSVGEAMSKQLDTITITRIVGDNVTDTPTRDRLITEARRLFATRGFRGASVRDITSAAHANLGAITYHFGSKRALYDAVLESTLAELVMGVEDAAAQPGTSAERLRDICRTLFRFFREHPATPRLILHELAGRAGLPPAIVPFIRRNLAVVRGVRSRQRRPLTAFNGSQSWP